MVEVTSLIRATFLGLQIGMTLILITAGLTLIFGMMDVINIAHGSLYMLGAYFGLVLVQSTGQLWLAILIAPLLVAVVGLAMEVVTLRPLYGRNPLDAILLTFGLLILFEEAVRILWGAQVRLIEAPPIFDGSVDLGIIAYPSYRAFLLAISTVVVLAIWLVLTRTNLGILMRASAHDAEMIDALGINVSKVFTAVFVVGAGLAGLAGVLVGAQQGFEPTTGVQVIIEAFAIVVIGGLGSFRGAVAGALMVGLMQAYVAIIYPTLTELSVFVLMTIVLIIRPTGLFSETTVA